MNQPSDKSVRSVAERAFELGHEHAKDREFKRNFPGELAALMAEEQAQRSSTRHIVAGMDGDPVEVPVCDAHAASWFTERNHLKGGMDAKCIVCAHEAHPSATREPQWTPTYVGDNTWLCAEPPCWLLVDDMLHPDREPWVTYWDGRSSPLNATNYRIIGYYKTPLPPAERNLSLPPERKSP